MGVIHAKEPNSHRDGDYVSRTNVTQNKYNYEHNHGENVFHKDTPIDPFHSPQAKEEEPIDFGTIKTRVDKIHIDGLIRTKDDIVKAQVKELFKAHNFRDVVLSIRKVQSRLEALECFSKIGVFVDISKGPDASPEGVEVTFTVRELKRLAGAIQTMAGNNEGSLCIGIKAPNIFGRAERLQAEYSHGIKSSSNLNISATKPLLDNSLNTILTGSLFTTSGNFPWSGYTQRDCGLLLDMAFNPGGSGTVRHNFQYEAIYREIIASKQASFHVRKECGPSLKSSLRHIFSLDRRDGTVFPTSGSLLQFSTEIAGLGGDIGFVKNELIMQSNWTLFNYFTFQLGLQSGLLRGISNDMKINLADNFFLGGPMNIRGFAMRGCGPHHNGNAVGGDVYWALALHVYTPLPFRPGHRGFGDLFRLHGFINGGNLAKFTFKFDNDYKDNMKIFTHDVRCSVGGGLAMRLANTARIELNLIIPWLRTNTDVLQQVQFGIGVHYL